MGYLLKQITGTYLVRAVRTIATPRSARRSAASWATSPTGLTNRQIGAELFLAEKTVENYVSSLLHELGMSRRTEAAVYAADRRRAGRTD